MNPAGNPVSAERVFMPSSQHVPPRPAAPMDNAQRQEEGSAEPEIDWSQILNESSGGRAQAPAAVCPLPCAPMASGYQRGAVGGAKASAVRLAPRRQSTDMPPAVHQVSAVPTGLATPIMFASYEVDSRSVEDPNPAPVRGGGPAPDEQSAADGAWDAQGRPGITVPTAQCAPSLRANVSAVDPVDYHNNVFVEPSETRDVPRTAVAPVQTAPIPEQASVRPEQPSESESVSQPSSLYETVRQGPAGSAEGPPTARNSTSSLHRRFLEATSRSSFASRRHGRSMDGGTVPVVESRVVSLIPEEMEVTSVKLMPSAKVADDAGRLVRPKITVMNEPEHYSSSDRDSKAKQRRYKKGAASGDVSEMPKTRHQRRTPPPPPANVRYYSDDEEEEERAAYASDRRPYRPKSRGSTRSAYDDQDEERNYWGYASRNGRVVRSLSRMSDREDWRAGEEYARGYQQRSRYRPKSAQPELWNSQSDNSEENDVQADPMYRSHGDRGKMPACADSRIAALFKIPAWRHYLNEHWRQFGFFPTYEQLQYYSMAQQQQIQLQKQSATVVGGGAVSRAAPVRVSSAQCGYGTAQSVFAMPFPMMTTVQSQQVAEPFLYGCPHAIARFGIGGRLVTCLQGRDAKGVQTVVEVHNVRSYIENLKVLSDCQLMEAFPGPLDASQTAKDGVLQYCNKRLDQLGRVSEHRDHQNMLLLLQFFVLMIRQNGIVNGKDLAHMLLECSDGVEDGDGEANEKGQPELASDSDNDFVIPLRVVANGSRTVATKGVQTTDMAEREFTRLLLRGYKKEALDWAVRTRLWGHALFLAMKMNRHSHMTVMTRFANSLPIDSPLQTLYQMLSGGVPYSSTRLPDKSWTEWRAHLAMILANLTSNDEQVIQRELYGVLTMGNTLLNVGQVYGAQFCYVCCQLLANWNIFDSGERQTSPLVTLVGLDSAESSSAGRGELPVFNYVLSELLEYALALHWLHSSNCSFWIVPLQKFKMRYAILLAELGYPEEAFAYCQALAKAAAYEAALTNDNVDGGFVENLYDLTVRLQRFNPEAEVLGDGAPALPDWMDALKSLRSGRPQVLRGDGPAVRQVSNATIAEADLTIAEQMKHCSSNSPSPMI